MLNSNIAIVLLMYYCHGHCCFYCSGEIVDLSDYDYNAVASLLKLYLRELPEPLIPQRLLTKMEAATQCMSTCYVVCVCLFEVCTNHNEQPLILITRPFVCMSACQYV